MKKQVTIEVTVCDYCGSDRYMVLQCPLCGRDVCSKCGLALTSEGYNFHICKEHKHESFEKVFNAIKARLSLR